MNYQPRPGVSLVSICGMPVLVPTRAAYEHCRQIQKIPLMWAILWEALSQGKPLDQVVEANCILTRKSEAEVRQKLDGICRALCEKGYMVETEEDTP